VKKSTLIIITGLSGSGKSSALAALEDAGFYCVDNMPVVLMPRFLQLPVADSESAAALAFVMDLRDPSFLAEHRAVFDDLEQRYDITLLFMEADESTLVQRYSQTRRVHPLAAGKRLLEAIRDEKQMLAEIRQRADRVIDTSRTNIHELKKSVFRIAEHIRRPAAMRIQLMTFGFKYGIPPDADLLVDVRFLDNPYFVPELKDLDGESEAVEKFVLQSREAHLFLRKYFDLLDYLIPLYEKEGKSYLTVAVGCTGGRHRSVVIARHLQDRILQSGKHIEITHRDLHR
jgi:UPF0042 nucleotide-binding protein